MTYNLRFGGGERLAAIADVIAARNPDVVALQELGRPADRRDGASPMRRLAAALGMRGYAGRWGPLPFGQPVGVLVRPDLRVLSAGPVRGPFHHGAVRVTVDTDPGPLTVLSAHLCPYSGTGRLCEARRLGRLADGRAGAARPVLLLGDLNSLDPWTDPADLAATVARLPARYRLRHLRRDGRVDTRAVAALARAGFTDLFRAVGTGQARTAPTGYAGKEFSDGQVSGGQVSGGQVSGMRLDYALGNGPLAGLARDCRVVTGGAAHTASDHYPVAVTLDLRPRTL
jgi:endonuclease/exonuclease/phosphatase family metal-dependent hydrolase